MRNKRIRNITLPMIAVIGFFSALMAEEKEPGFSLYYGNDPVILKKMAQISTNGSVTVIETRALSEATLERLSKAVREKKGKILAYLSIGELHSSQKVSFLKVAGESFDFDDIVINKNNVFDSWRLDVLSPDWQKWIHVQAAEILSVPGIDGLFLDTVDTIDVYSGKKEWKLERCKESIDAMMALVRSLKHNHPEKYFLQNGGLNMIGETMFIGNESGINIPGMALNKQHPANPDGLLWENAFEGTDDWTMGRLADMRKARKAGFTRIFALGYRKAYPKPENFFKKCRAEKFTGAWSVSSELLHEEPTFGPSGQPGDQ